MPGSGVVIPDVVKKGTKSTTGRFELVGASVRSVIVPAMNAAVLGLPHQLFSATRSRLLPDP